MKKNIEMIEIVADRLKEHLDNIVFTGGATVILYLDDKGAPDPRPTYDIDCVIEVTYVELIKFEKELRKLGFTQPLDTTLICRWEYNKIIVDFIPNDDKAFGFSNFWHKIGFKNALEYNINNKLKIKIFPAPIFISSKFQAFKNRGQNDYRTSQDIEDIITILNGRNNIYEEIKNSDQKLKTYIVQEFLKIYNNNSFNEIIYSNLDVKDRNRQNYIAELIKKICHI